MSREFSMSFSASSVSTGARTIDWSAYAKHCLLTITFAVLANSVVYFLASVLIGYDPEFLPLGNVSGAIIFTIFPAIIACLIYAVLLRSTAHAARIFTVLAVIVLCLSFIPDLTYIP